MTLVDTNVLLDVLQGDAVWADWSRAALNLAAAQDTLFINPLVYAELSLAFVRVEELEAVVHEAGLEYRELPKEALFLGAKAFQAYRRGHPSRTRVLPDFLIGAHAAVTGAALLTRDRRTYRTWFPTVRLIAPEMG
jgi:predicted nucleic acid-binding protein